MFIPISIKINDTCSKYIFKRLNSPPLHLTILLRMKSCAEFHFSIQPILNDLQNIDVNWAPIYNMIDKGTPLILIIL